MAAFCTPSDCSSYWSGHRMHPIHANHVARSPWGWRDGTVAVVEPDGWATVAYAFVDGRVRVWHHARLDVAVGDPVGVHEGLHALAGASGMVNVVLDDGLGAVPDPSDAARWQGAAVTDLGSGRAAIPGQWGV